ncbi:PIN domain-containing protein [Ferrimicrobium acidiphilum]|uniref:PIN domain-containing protein n=1 Tax=Ferrimicrobium acidiphilum TaxID=121039 RepID=UPI0023F564BB|nr:PIN domain-containing protein [Ferrimicrobium acidiphilum]
MRRLRILLDANVLVDAQVRDIFCTMAEAQLIDLYWSNEILREARQALTAHLKLDSKKVERMLEAFAAAFPDGIVIDHEPLIYILKLPDPKDRHVLAAAVSAKCDLLVTYNTKDFPPSEASKHDLEVVDVDEALCELTRRSSNDVATIIKTCITRMKKPKMQEIDFLRRLERRAPLASILIGSTLGIEPYANMHVNAIASFGTSSSHSAVIRIIEAIRDRHTNALVEMIDSKLTHQLTGRSSPGPEELWKALRDSLIDVLSSDGWSLATAPRLPRPDTEIVKLVRTGPTVEVAWEPRLVPAHTFQLKYGQQGWVLVKLDDPDSATT